MRPENYFKEQVSRIRTVRVLYRAEVDGWWAESPDFPGYTAVGRDYGEVRQMAHEGLSSFAGEALEYSEEIIAPNVSKDLVTFTYGLSFKFTDRFRGFALENPMELPSTRGFASRSG